MSDLWTWRAVYKDGGEIKEYDDAGAEHSFREADSDRVKSIILEPSSSELPPFTVDIKEGATPVCFRRRSIHIQGDGTESGRSTAHCIGWRTDDAAQYLFVFEDGSTLLTDDLNAV